MDPAIKSSIARMDLMRLDTLQRWYDGTMLPDQLFEAMTSEQEWFATQPIRKGGAQRDFAVEPRDLSDLEIRDHGRTFDFYDYFSINSVAGLIVLRDGKMIHETYQRGLTPQSLWHSCSMAKSISATLVGIALKEGKISSLDDPSTYYCDVGGVYSRINVRQLLRMNSGAQWSEDYGDRTSERRRVLEVQTKRTPGGIIDFMSQVQSAVPVGKAWAYNTGDSYLVSVVMEGATNLRLADYLSEKLWSKLGMEHDARWWAEAPDGMIISGSGLNASLRDYARFGQFVLDGGVIDGDRILPAGWNDEAGRPYDIDGVEVPYGYMWWIPQSDDPLLKGTFQAVGIYGQFIHINPAKRIVAVVASMRSKPGMKRRFEITDNAFFAALARAL